MFDHDVKKKLRNFNEILHLLAHSEGFREVPKT